MDLVCSRRCLKNGLRMLAAVTRSTGRENNFSRASLSLKYVSAYCSGGRSPRSTRKSRSPTRPASRSMAADPKRSSRFTPKRRQSAWTSALCCLISLNTSALRASDVGQVYAGHARCGSEPRITAGLTSIRSLTSWDDPVFRTAHGRFYRCISLAWRTESEITNRCRRMAHGRESRAG